MHLLPTRQDFIAADMRRAFQAQVNAGKPILFLPSTVVEKNEYVDGCMKHRIYLFGILPCGSKTCVVLDGVEVHFDIRVPTGLSSQAYDSILRGQMMAQGLHFTKVEDVKMFPLHGFHTEPCVYKRIHFNNLQDRKKCLEFINLTNKALKTAGKELLETAADDTGRDCYYFPKVAREFRFATADWNRIETYVQLDARTVTTNCTYAFRVDVKNFKKLDKKRRGDIKSAANGMSKVIDRDNTLVTQWDIETHTTVQNGQVPTPADRNFTIFMICSAYCWQWTDEAMLGVCCVDTMANARKGVPIVIVCGTERDVLQAHIEAVGKMSPEILAAFNGSHFDWPLFREKCRREGLLLKLKQNFSSLPMSTKGRYADTEESVLKWSFRSERVKIDAETNHDMECVADFAGMLDTDVLPIFLKMYPRAEVRKAGSLNFFLAKNGLESKEDMPYKRMFRIYERSLRMSAIKACHCGDAQHHCATCQEKIPDIDCKPKEGPSAMDAVEYSDELHDDLIGEHGPNCCHCGKKPRSARDMADVGYYCIIDCTRPQQLYVKRTIVPDKRELSTMSYMPLRDSFFRADGSKVRNLIGSYCFRRGIAFSNARSGQSGSDKDHYPGAWVFPPNRGLHSDGKMDIEITRKDGTKVKKTIQCRPITGLDFASLYPSLMMTFNLSPDKVVYTREEAERLRALGYSMHHIKPFKYEKGEKKGAAGNRQMIGEGWTVRHNGVFNPKTDKNIIDSYTKYEKYEWSVNGTPTVTKVATQTTNTSTGIVTPAPVNDMANTLATLKAAGVKVKRSVTYEPTRGRAALPGEQMGIFAFIVKKLFDKRVPIKAEFVRYCHLKEQMEKDKLKTIEVKNPDGSVTVLDFKADVCFNLNKIESKQKALKVLMNTFYGESGNYQSSVYELLVAAGITCAGQENIKLVAEFVESKGFIVQYGDTDSVYISPPDEVYAECDAVYKAEIIAIREQFAGVADVPEPISDAEKAFKAARIAARRKWWEAQVDITMRLMMIIKEEVSDFLLAHNGTLYLNVAYEEVGFPTVFAGKKKYFLKAHIGTVNFDGEEVFIRGIDIIKQGQARIAKTLGEEFMREALSPENERELIDLAEDKIRKFYATPVNPANFQLTARYRPNKRNVPVQTFVARMRDTQKRFASDPTSAALYEPPDAGDKFDFVIVKKNQRYTLQGCKIDIKKGDQMEFVRVYKASQSCLEPMVLDLNYYMKNAIVGLFARFIAYHPKFQPPEGMFDTQDKLQYRNMDMFCVNAANKYLEALCDRITGFDKGALTQTGKDYRAIWKHADKRVRQDLLTKFGGVSYVIHGLDIHSDETDRARSTQIIDQIRAFAKESIKAGIGRRFIKVNKKRPDGLSMFALRRVYSTGENCISRIRVRWCDKRDAQLIEELYKAVPPVATIAYKYEKRMINLIDDMRKARTEEATLDDDEVSEINNLDETEKVACYHLHALIISYVAIQNVRASTLEIAAAIEIERAQLINEPIAPVMNTRVVAAAEAKHAGIIPEYEFK